MNYASWAHADFFVTTNLKETRIFKVVKGKIPDKLEEIVDIPNASKANNQKEIDKLLKQTKAFTRDEFSKLLFKCHNIIRNNDKLSPEAAFDEISKILFIKIRYERSNSDSQIFSAERFTALKKSREEYNKENCGSCDNCRSPKEKFDGKEDLKLVLEAVEDTKQLFKTKHIAELLSGKLTGDIKAAKQENNEFFGAGDEHDEKYWTAVIRQALVNKLLSKDIENYGILKITKEGKSFIKKPYTIMLVKDHDYENSDDDDPETLAAMGSNKDGGADKTLFALLKDLRKTIAKQNNLPPYVIFQDPSLEDMAIQYPITKEEMTQIAGVGAGKAEKFGEPFIKLIKEYVEENEITRPNDMVVKSVVNNSAHKIGIIKNIDKKIPLDDIAYGLGLSFDELLSEIESIVSSGTHLDINYFIEDYVDIYHQEDILDYFHESESDDVQAALRELGEDEYEEEEVRLMRIKFLSDVGN